MVNLSKFIMKKLFFTAIAMVAFSAVSMANTIEVKEAVEFNKNEAKNIPTLYCMVASAVVFADLYNAGINEEDCFAEMNAAFWDCVQ